MEWARIYLKFKFSLKVKTSQRLILNMGCAIFLCVHARLAICNVSQDFYVHCDYFQDHVIFPKRIKEHDEVLVQNS